MHHNCHMSNFKVDNVYYKVTLSLVNYTKLLSTQFMTTDGTIMHITYPTGFQQQ